MSRNFGWRWSAPVSGLQALKSEGKKGGTRVREGPRHASQVSQGGFGLNCDSRKAGHGISRTSCRTAAGLAFQAGAVADQGEISTLAAGIAFIAPHPGFADLA